MSWITETKPMIQMSKFDESAFVNARTYWSLTFHSAGDDPSYELQVRHSFGDEGDSFRFVSHDAAFRDPLELVTDEELANRMMQLRIHEDMSHADALDAITAKYSVMSTTEKKILDHLHRHWDAFVLLFNPAVNL